MDIPVAPPVSAAAPIAPQPFAFGEAPRWTLVHADGAVVLAIAGRPPLKLVSSGWQATPAGRALRMTTADGRPATLLVVHALRAGGPGRSAGNFAATLSIGGQRLMGCLSGGGDRPYPGR